MSNVCRICDAPTSGRPEDEVCPTCLRDPATNGCTKCGKRVADINFTFECSECMPEVVLTVSSHDIKKPKFVFTPKRNSIKLPLGMSPEEEDRIFAFANSIRRQLQPLGCSLRGNVLVSEKLRCVLMTESRNGRHAFVEGE
jgi:hypothetical protein